eukprot:10785265-Alexandrium_andersonii.AAC.1
MRRTRATPAGCQPMRGPPQPTSAASSRRPARRRSEGSTQGGASGGRKEALSLIHISEPTRLALI